MRAGKQGMSSKNRERAIYLGSQLGHWSAGGNESNTRVVSYHENVRELMSIKLVVF